MGHFADKFKGKIKTDFAKFYLNTGEAKDFAREFQLLLLLPTPWKQTFLFSCFTITFHR